jgi:hypothetical protein
MIFSPARARRELVSHECHLLARKLSSSNVLLWVGAMFSLLLAARSVSQSWSSSNRRNLETTEWGPASAKLDPEMEDKNGQNPIQTAEIFAAADARNRPDTSAISARQWSRRSSGPTDRTDARALWFDRQWFDHRCARDQTQRGVHLGEDEGNRMRDKLPRTSLAA